MFEVLLNDIFIFTNGRLLNEFLKKFITYFLFYYDIIVINKWSFD